MTSPACTTTLDLAPSANYGADSFIANSDGAGETNITVAQSSYLVGSEADLNAALALIDAGGKFFGPNTNDTITLTASFALSADLDAIDLGTGSSVTINGAGFTIDGTGTTAVSSTTRAG